MTRLHGDASCPHLTTPLYCVCREQGHDPATGCLLSIELPGGPDQTDGDSADERAPMVELSRSPRSGDRVLAL